MMSVREKIKSETINSKGFAAIGELMENYVYLQPAGVHISKIWVVERNEEKVKTVKRPASIQVKFKSGYSVPIKGELAKDTKNRLLGRVSRSLKLGPSVKVYPKRSLIEYSKSIYNENVGIKGVVNAEFEEIFLQGSYHLNTRIPYISNKKLNILLESDLVYKFLDFKSPYSDTKFSILFQPSRYLEEEKDLWKLVVILGEIFFTEQLAVNHNLVNERFVVDSFTRSGQVFYFSPKNRKVFATSNERIKYRNDDLEKISLISVLELDNADINMVEEVLEKGDRKY
ncbi:hypothetical protein [Flavobacterium sp. 245]|uniref:hypothetical protein n=1 Tax=Flavobacterium sp. 245 TaxID=2512115 RepID=UPI00105BFAC6|nr:hypothetical protein [Flavobacterium sp. 245]TDO97107.1 hypothetical protein EV145_110128 [Flavobacterium sp. 245]